MAQHSVLLPGVNYGCVPSYPSVTHPFRTYIPSDSHPMKTFTGEEFNRIYKQDLFKMLHDDMKHFDFTWRDNALNVDPHPEMFDMTECCGGRLYFTDAVNLRIWYSDSYKWLCRVRIPSDATVHTWGTKMASTHVITESRVAIPHGWIDNEYWDMLIQSVGVDKVIDILAMQVTYDKTIIEKFLNVRPNYLTHIFRLMEHKPWMINILSADQKDQIVRWKPVYGKFIIKPVTIGYRECYFGPWPDACTGLSTVRKRHTYKLVDV